MVIFKIIFVFVILNLQTVKLFSQQVKKVEAISLSGDPLYKIELTPDRKKEFEEKYNFALQEFLNDSLNVDKFIWVGRQIAYLGNYNDAINWYTIGLKKFPDNYKILRHRRHRYLSIRQFGNAQIDLEKASKLISNIPDEIEADGLPNKFNIPTSTTHTNIWYHLGLAFYFQKNYKKSEEAFNECLKFSKNDDMICATIDWLYTVKRRLNKKDDAQKLLDKITTEMQIIENHAYFNRLLLYKGLKTPQELYSDSETDPVTIATQGYGIGCWYLVNGDTLKAKKYFKEVLKTSNWSAFGFIASEVEVAE